MGHNPEQRQRASTAAAAYGLLTGAIATVAAIDGYAVSGADVPSSSITWHRKCLFMLPAVSVILDEARRPGFAVGITALVNGVDSPVSYVFGAIRHAGCATLSHGTQPGSVHVVCGPLAAGCWARAIACPVSWRGLHRCRVMALAVGKPVSTVLGCDFPAVLAAQMFHHAGWGGCVAVVLTT